MLNNEFRLIGIVITDYEKIGTDDFPKYKITIEVEKRKKADPAHIDLIAYKANYALDITKSPKGKQVIANGYIDEYKGKYQFILQDMIIIGEKVVESEEPKTEIPPDTSIDDLDLPDDDLPF